MTGFVTYLAVTLLGAVAAVFATRGALDPAMGIALAWVVQAVAFWRLEVAFDDGRNATAAWLGGMAARLAALIAVGSASFIGVVDTAVVVAYGVTMVVLLLLEAGWLFRRLSWPETVKTGGTGVESGIEGTHGTG